MSSNHDITLMNGTGGHFPPQQPPPPPSVKLSVVIHRVVENAYSRFTRLFESLRNAEEDNQRKLLILDYLEQTRNQFIRLLVLVKWAQGPAVNNLDQRFWNIIHFLNFENATLQESADKLWWLHNETLRKAKTPLYDIPNAIDVLSTGDFRFPTCLKERLTRQPQPSQDEVQQFFQRLDHLIHFRLITTAVPPQLSIIIKDGKALCSMKNEFNVTLTLQGESPTLPWRVLSLEILVADANEKDRESSENNSINEQLMQHVQGRMTEAQHPFVELWSHLHNFCLALQLDILYTQSRQLSLTRRSDMMKIDFNKDRLCLIIYYWKNLDKIGTTPLPLSDPTNNFFYLKIFVDTHGELTIAHNPAITDPLTNSPATFSVDPASVNAETLLVRALRLHAYSMLQNLYNALLKSEHTSISKTDLRLIADEDVKKVALKIRLFEGRFLSVSVDLRSGAFVLNHRSIGFNEDKLRIKEADLNKDNSKIIPTVTSLRYLTILSFFEGMAHWLKLETFHSLQWDPESPVAPRFSQQTVFMNFPTVPSFFLAVEIDKKFKPKFFLLKTRRTDGSLMKLRLEEQFDVLQHSAFNLMNIMNNSETTNGRRALTNGTSSEVGKRGRPSAVSTQSPSTGGSSKRARIEPHKDPNLPSDEQSRGEDQEKLNSENGVDLEEEEEEFDSKTSSTYSNYKLAFISIVDTCRRKLINYVTCQRYLTDANIHSRKVGEDIAFPIPTDWLDKKLDSTAYLRFIDESAWEVHIKVLQPILEFLQFDKPQYDDTIICTPTLWRFCYKRLPKEAIGLFFAELKGLIKLMDLAKQTESILFSPNPNDPSSSSSLSSSHNNNHTHQNYRSLREYYKVQSFKPSKLTFSYGEYRTLTIRGKQDPKPLIFSPRPHLLKRFMESSFRMNSSIFALLQTVMRTTEPVERIMEFYTATSSSQASSPSPSPTSSSSASSADYSVTTIDLCMVPRSVTQVRLIYRNLCAIDIRFLMDDMVLIDDASQPLFPTAVTQHSRFYELKKFEDFATKFLQPLNQKVNPNYQQPTPLPTTSISPKPCLVYHNVLFEALHKVHQFMASYSLWRNCLKVLEEKEKEGLLRRANSRRQENFEMSFTTQKPRTQDFTLFIKDYASLEIRQTNATSLRSSYEGVFSDSASVFNSEDFNNGDTMTVEEMNEIAHMFRKKASCPPYLSQNVSTFMRVLTLPPEVRREIHELLRQEPEGGSMLASNLLTSSSISSLLPTTGGPSAVSLEMVWCMQAPPNATQQGTLRTELGLPSGNPVNIPVIPNIGEPSFVHKDINQEIYFVVRFWITGQPYRFINIPLRYRYAPPQGLYLWTLLEKIEPTTTPTLNTTSHTLVSAIAVLRRGVANYLASRC